MIPTPTPALETKTLPLSTIEFKSSETTDNLADMARAFEAFKITNDQRLAELSAKQSSDVLTGEKLARIERTMDDLALKAARPVIGGAAPASSAHLAHKSAFDTYVRQGEVGNLRALESKALSATSDPDGGYVVPPELEAVINRSLVNISPIRAIAGIRQVSSSVYKRPYSIAGLDTGWVGETAARPQGVTPTLASTVFNTMELYAMPAATSTLLDDAAVNVDQWLATEVQIAFAMQEGKAFVSGDGIAKPKGFLSYDTVANTSYVWGKLGTLSTGVAGSFPTSAPSDKLIDLIYSVKAGYRPGSHFVMNRATQSAVRKFKDSLGEYLWQPSYQPGVMATLLGYPVAESEDMPDIAPGSSSIAFGDFSRGYLIIDRVGIRVLRDPYSAKPYVLFYTTKRVGGGVADFDAIKLLKFQA